MSLKVVSHSGNSLIIELYQYQGIKKGHVCVGSFEVQAVEDQLSISAEQNWRTRHRNDVELSHFSNTPKFHLEQIGVFSSFKVKEQKQDGKCLVDVKGSSFAKRHLVEKLSGKCSCVHPSHGGDECGRPVKEGSNLCEGCLNNFLNELKNLKEDLDEYGM